jgi:hypothetical protein
MEHSPSLYTFNRRSKVHHCYVGSPKLEAKYSFVANRMTLNEAVMLREEVKGMEFDVKYFSTEDMERGENDLTPSVKKTLLEEMCESMKSMLASAGMKMATGQNDIDLANDLVVEFLDIKPLAIKEVWEEWNWKWKVW